MYYLVEISTGDEKIAGKAIYSYNALTDAVAAYHSKMGNAMKSDLFTSELLLVINEDGMLINVDKYSKEVGEVNE